MLLFLINIVVHHHARRRRRRSTRGMPARLEWMTSSPPKEHNFDGIPTVHALDEFFHRKYEEVDTETGEVW